MPKSKERCQKIRKEMPNTILHKLLLYFARNGFAGKKISDLTRSIGIGQGTIYVHFDSKEEFFQEILKLADYMQELKQLRMLLHLPVSAKKEASLFIGKRDKTIAGGYNVCSQNCTKHTDDFGTE